MKSLRRLSPVLLASLLLSVPTWAQEQGDGTLHVLRPLVHAEQEEGEFCLEFDHDIEPADHRRIVSTLHLESGGKNLNVASRNVSLDGNLFCVSGLDHQREYRFSLSGVKGVKGEKMAGSYSLAFTIPDRQPSLAFTSDTNTGFLRWGDNKDPLLRSLNVPRVTLELYRVTAPEMMVEAWRQRRQASLAPSESATFAHDHGQMVWSGAFDLTGDANKTLEQKVPLHDQVADVAPGLYLIVARAPEDKKKSDRLAPTGALWLLRSNLKIHALQDKDGFYALAEKTDGTEIVKNTQFVIEDANGQKLAESKSAEDGTSLLSLPVDKEAIATSLTGIAVSGDVDFTDLTQAGRLTSSAGGDASIKADKAFYSPAAPVTLTLTAHDQAGHPLNDANASLQINWADGNFYTTVPAVPDKNGVARLSLTVPGADGDWLMVWRGGDGRVLAQEKLRVTSNSEAPHLEMSADRTILPSSGDIDLTLQSQSIDDKPFPYLAGRMSVAWSEPDRVFQEWRDYHFGTSGRPAGDVIPLSSFLTNEKGMATLHLSLMPPDDGALLHTAILQAHSETAQGASDPVPLTLPVKPKDDIIGVKPLASEGRFPENSLARFSVIALDPDGHRKGIDDLAYQIFEEGRSFDWRQEEGRWGYKQLEQNRRLGGGALTIDDNQESILEWPVTAGNYRLEITDANGVLRTSFRFSSGWGGGETKPNLSSLDLRASASIVRPGQKTDIKFNLNSPSMVGAFIGDDHIRKIVHKGMPKGENVVSFAPEKDWGSPINVRIEAYNAGLIGQTSLFLHQEEQKLADSAPTENKTTENLSADLQLPATLRLSDSVRAVLDLKNNGKAAINYRLTSLPTSGIKISDTKDGVVTLPAGQSKKVVFTLSAVHTGMSTLRLDLSPPHVAESHEWKIEILPENLKPSLNIQQKLEPNEIRPNSADRQHAKVADDILFLSSTPLFNAPLLLADVVKAEPTTTAEIAGVSQVLRVWEEPIVEAGLLTNSLLAVRRETLISRLMSRQKSDGSFPALPGEVSDLNSTAQALMALAHADSPAAKPATDLAIAWLKHRLENTWFDEKERPLRSVAYQALAEADKLDVSSLHYFGDTSADKSLPPLAAAQLAFAFAKSGDQAKASFWLDVSGVHKNSDGVSASLLYVLAANPSFNSQEVAAIIERSVDRIKGDTDIETSTNFLLASWFAQHRMNNWRVTIGTDKKNPKDILVIRPPEKGPAVSIHNTGDGPVYISGLTQATALSARAVARHIYQLNGMEVEGRGPLERNETYLIILEGTWNTKDGSSVNIHDDLSPALRPIACLLPESGMDNSLAWLKNQKLGSQAACEISASGIDIVDKKEGADNWRVAYLAKAEWSGSFTLSPASARNIEGSPETIESGKTHVDIR